MACSHAITGRLRTTAGFRSADRFFLYLPGLDRLHTSFPRNWIVPTFNGELRAHKPVLLYWCMMAAYSLGGVNEFTARLPSALCAMGSALATYGIGRRLFGGVPLSISSSVLCNQVFVSNLQRTWPSVPDCKTKLIQCGICLIRGLPHLLLFGPISQPTSAWPQASAPSPSQPRTVFP